MGGVRKGRMCAYSQQSKGMQWHLRTLGPGNSTLHRSRISSPLDIVGQFTRRTQTAQLKRSGVLMPMECGGLVGAMMRRGVSLMCADSRQDQAVYARGERGGLVSI